MPSMTNSIQTHERQIRLSLYQKGLYAKKRFADMLGASAVMKALIEKARKYASHDSNLLIYGETGTEKEVLVQSVHNASRRKNGPFVSVNTASLSLGLLESELLGYVEGAFTGAKKGASRACSNSPMAGRFFSTRSGNWLRTSRAACCGFFQRRKSCASATTGSYRSTCESSRPPTQEGGAIELTQAALNTLMQYGWPGNIRQLRNVAEVIAYDGSGGVDERQVCEILAEQETRIESKPQAEPMTNKISLKALEADVLGDLLREHSADEVCGILCISRVTLWRKKKAFLQT